MITRGHKTYNQLIIIMLDKLSNINKWRKDFILETFILFLSIRSRINFLQLVRYGKHKEQRYRQQFKKPFDFLTFISQNEESMVNLPTVKFSELIYYIHTDIRFKYQSVPGIISTIHKPLDGSTKSILIFEFE
jgi:hypothetical protein